jgi:hypothetical protein
MQGIWVFWCGEGEEFPIADCRLPIWQKYGELLIADLSYCRFPISDFRFEKRMGNI